MHILLFILLGIYILLQADDGRAAIMVEGRELGAAATAHALSVDEPENTDELKQAYSAAHLDTDSTKLREVDLSMKTVSDNIQNDITK